jgi:hypothetical protein
VGLEDLSTNANLLLETSVMVNERLDFNQVMTTAQGLDQSLNEGAKNDYYIPCRQDLPFSRLSDALLRTAVLTRYQTSKLQVIASYQPI